MKFISWLFLAILIIATVSLSISNKAPVAFSLFPLPFEIEVPLFALILGGGFIGLLLGAWRTWVADGKTRRENRASKQEILRLKGELARLEKNRANISATSPDAGSSQLKISQITSDSKHSSAA